MQHLVMPLGGTATDLVSKVVQKTIERLLFALTSSPWRSDETEVATAGVPSGVFSQRLCLAPDTNARAVALNPTVM